MNRFNTSMPVPSFRNAWPLRCFLPGLLALAVALVGLPGPEWVRLLCIAYWWSLCMLGGVAYVSVKLLRTAWRRWGGQRREP